MMNLVLNRRALLGALTASLVAVALPSFANEAYKLEGYRSATFGMGEAEVRKAIAKDFPKELAKIKVEQHPMEQTQVLVIDAPTLVEDAGPAKISYVLGYKTKKLIQVNVVWGDAAIPDSKASVEDLKKGAQNLVRYFGQFDYKEGSVEVKKQLPDGSLIVFKANDDKNHTVSLRLGAVPKALPKDAKPDTKPDAAYFLRLSYVLDEANPDLYKIEKGAF
jgi:hypothetical protein